MTVAVGVRVPGEGAVLACDSRVLAGYDIVSDTCEKFLVCGSCVALVAGNDGGLMDAIAGTKNVQELHTAAFAYQEGKALNWSLLVYDRKADRLLSIDSDGCVLPLGLQATDGAGGGIALGVLSGQRPKDLAAAKRLVKRAVLTACKHNASCGGRTRIVTVRGKRGSVEVS